MAEQVDVVPRKRRDVREIFLGNILAFGAQLLNGSSDMRRVPGADGGDQQVQATRSMHLVLKGAVAELATLAHEEAAGNAVNSLAFVQCPLSSPSQLRVLQELKDENSLLQLADLVERPCNLILAWVRTQLGRCRVERPDVIRVVQNQHHDEIPASRIRRVAQRLDFMDAREATFNRASAGRRPVLHDLRLSMPVRVIPHEVSTPDGATVNVGYLWKHSFEDRAERNVGEPQVSCSAAAGCYVGSRFHLQDVTRQVD